MTYKFITFPQKTICRFLFSCLAMVFALNIFASDRITIQPFQMKDGRKIWGVVIRQSTHETLLAMPFEIRTLKRKDIMIPGGMSSEAAKVDEFLTLVENAIDSGEIGRVGQLLAELEKAIIAFEQMVQPFLDSSMETPHKRRECLENSMRYYRNKKDGLPQSVRCLKIAGRAKDLETSLAFHSSKYHEDSLSEVVNLLTGLRALNNLTPKATRRKEEALLSLEELFEKLFSFLKTQALDELQSGNSAAPSLGLIKILRQETAGDSSEFEEKMEEILTDVLAASSEVRKKIQATISRLFTTVDNSEAYLKSYMESTEVLKVFMSFLVESQEHIFGSRRDALMDSLSRDIEMNEKLLEKTSKSRELYLQVRSDIRQANLLLEKEHFEDAITKFRTLAETIQKSNFSSEDFQEIIRRGILRSQALMYLSKLENPSHSSPDIMDQHLEECKNFLERNESVLEDLGISVSRFKKGIKKLGNYKKFLLRREDLDKELASKPLSTWNRIQIMSKWMNSLGTMIHERAYEEWKTFKAENEETTFKKATRLFYKQGSYSSRSMRVFISFVHYSLQKANPDQALELLDKSSAEILESDNESVISEFVTLYMHVAEYYIKESDFDKALEIYRFITSKYTKYSQITSVEDQLVSQFKILAESYMTQGKFNKALTLYKAIAAEYPEYAEQERILDTIVETAFAEVRDSGGTSDDDLEFINNFCNSYGGLVASIPLVRERSEKIISQFVTIWKNENYVDASKAYIEFHEKYPAFSRELKILFGTIRQVRNEVYKTLQSSKTSMSSIPATLISALTDLTKKFPLIAKENKLDEIFVDLKLLQAERFLRMQQVAQAFDIYQEIIATNPEIAQNKKLFKKMEQLKWKYRIETIFEPLGVKTPKDWVAFGMTILIWGFLFVRIFVLQRRNGHLNYRLLHYVTVLTIFIALVSCFLYGKFSFFASSLIAFIVPGISFLSLAFSTYYLFFPLVYCERILAIEMFMSKMGNFLFRGKVPLIQNLITFLEKDSCKRQDDLPLLHDRILYKIHKAIIVSLSKPEKGYELFKALLERLNQEIVKKESWKKHYSTCLFNLGAVAYHMGREEEAFTKLNEHLEYDPKHVDTRQILGDILFDRKEYQMAIPHLRICLAGFGHNDALWFKLGRCFFETGNYVGGYKCFSSIGTKSRETLFFEARSYSKAHELGKAVHCYQTLLKHYPDDSEIIYYLSSSFALHKDDAKALKILELINKDDPFFPRANALMGSILYRAKKVKDANEMYVFALKLDPNCILAITGLGQIACDVNKFDQALSLFEKALQLDPDYAAANYFSGILYEDSDPSKAIFYLERAGKSPDFKVMANRRLGFLQFYSREYEQAAKHLEIVEKQGEKSPWSLFILAFSLAASNQLDNCGKILSQISGLEHSDQIWSTKSVYALYSIGLKLFEKNDFSLALKCFEFVKAKTQSLDHNKKSLENLLEESKFRMVIQLLGKGKVKEAEETLLDIKGKTNDHSRKVQCEFYLALCLLFTFRYKEAKNLLGKLTKNYPENPRYLYHLTIAELGLGHDQAAAKLLLQLRDFSNTPGHLKVGIHTIRGYLTAKQGKMSQADSSLANIPEFAMDFPGSDYLRQKVNMSRIFYLCHARDSKKIYSLIPELSGDHRVHAALLHAIAAIESGQLKIAKDILKPHVDESQKVEKLFSTLCSELAMKAISKKDYKQARDIFDEISTPPESIENVCLLLNMTIALEEIRDFESITQALLLLGDYLSKVQDIKLSHTLVHNLGILHLKRAITAEEYVGRRDDMMGDLWLSCWNFWAENILNSKEYWNREQKNLTKNKQQIKPFSQKEVEVISKNFVEENFVNMFIAYSLIYVDQSDDSGVARHLHLLEITGEFTGNSKNYFTRLREEYTEHQNAIVQDGEKFNSWDYYICTNVVESFISEKLEQEDAENLKSKLENYKKCRELFPSLKEYQEIQKQHNSYLLDALHLGVNEDFSAAGSKLDMALENPPPGMFSPGICEELKTLRETCSKSGKNPDLANHLKKDFENLYESIKNKKLDTQIALH